MDQALQTFFVQNNTVNDREDKNKIVSSEERLCASVYCAIKYSTKRCKSN